MSKTCSKCKIEKSLDEFNNRKDTADGKRKECKLCKNAKIFIQEEAKEHTLAHGKVCGKCNTLKPASEYYDKKQSVDGKFGTCKECYDEHQKNRVEGDPDHPKKQVERVRRYRDRHRDRLRQEQQDRRHTDPVFKARYLLSQRIRDCVKHKTSNFSEYLGCSIEYFRAWMEFLFLLDSNMSWENHGTYWHYDHVIPCKHLDCNKEDEAKKCFNWTNIRPCEKGENMSKSDKVIPELLKDHQDYVEMFIELHGAPN